MTSILRDTLVQPPSFRGHNFGKIKLTTVYHMGSFYDNGNIAGSMELMNQTLYDNFGVVVDYNFEIDFDVFIEVIDMMYGVMIELTEAEAQYLNNDDLWVPYDVQPGWFNLDGTGTLSYARMRKAEGDADSDIPRTERQRKIINAVIQRLRKMRLSEVQDIIDTALSKVTTSMPKADMLKLAAKLLPMLPELQIKKGGTCPITIEGTQIQSWGEMVDIYKDGQLHSVLYFQNQKEYMRAITEGDGLDTLPPESLARINGEE